MAELDRLRKLQSVTDAALAHLSLDALLDELLTRIRDALGADTSAILLVDEETDELVARAAKGIEEEVERGVRIPIGAGFAGRVAAERRPVLLPDVDHADVLNPILREKGIKSLLGAPLVVGEVVLGVVHVGTLTPRDFGAADVELLELVAARAALAIERSRLFESERRAHERLERLQSVTDAALAHLSVDELLDALLDRIRDALAADTCAVLLLDPERNELVARAARGIEEEVERGVRIPVGGGFAGRIAADAKTVVLPDVDHADVLNPILREKGIKSLLGSPLVSGGRVLGVVHVGTLTPRDFTADDVELLEVVAQRVAMGLDRAFVHEALMQLDELQRSFVALASHELRTPVAAIYGSALTLEHRRGTLAPETEEELRRVLTEQAHRLAALVEQLLDLSRLEAGGVELRPQRIGLRERIESLIVATAPTRARDVDVRFGPEVQVEADPHALDRVRGNLLTNAFRYGAPPIVVSAAPAERQLRIAVEDHGAGVAPQFVPRLFERFARADGRAYGTGSGLGLAIARAYAVALGGDLRYEPANGGARFVFVLPEP